MGHYGGSHEWLPRFLVYAGTTIALSHSLWIMVIALLLFWSFVFFCFDPRSDRRRSASGTGSFRFTTKLSSRAHQLHTVVDFTPDCTHSRALDGCS